jgi:DNA-binding transcriptional MerR regulator
MQIGEVAERTGLSLRTIRYYEEVGLVTPSARTPGGFRVYTTADAERLELVKRMKSLEFTLEETRLLLTLLSLLGGDLPGDERRRRLEELATWCTEVDWRCGLMRERLQIAEGLGSSLDREIARQRGEAGPVVRHQARRPRRGRHWAGEAAYEERYEESPR